MQPERMSWQGAERFAAQWMRAAGWSDAHCTQAGADGGVDVRARGAVAQVKYWAGGAVSIKDVQRTYGIAVHERATTIIFSRSGYTKQATDWAEVAGVLLFTFDEFMVVRGATSTARRLASQVSPLAPEVLAHQQLWTEGASWGTTPGWVRPPQPRTSSTVGAVLHLVYVIYIGALASALFWTVAAVSWSVPKWRGSSVPCRRYAAWIWMPWARSRPRWPWTSTGPGGAEQAVVAGVEASPMVTSWPGGTVPGLNTGAAMASTDTPYPAPFYPLPATNQGSLVNGSVPIVALSTWPTPALAPPPTVGVPLSPIGPPKVGTLGQPAWPADASLSASELLPPDQAHSVIGPMVPAQNGPLPPAAAAPAHGQLIAGDGVYRVGHDVAPGLYRTPGPSDPDSVGGYWARLGSFSGDLDDVIASGLGTGAVIVQIAATDVGFETSSFQPWERITD